MEFLNNIQLTGDITTPEGKPLSMGGGSANSIIRPTGRLRTKYLDQIITDWSAYSSNTIYEYYNIGDNHVLLFNCDIMILYNISKKEIVGISPSIKETYPNIVENGLNERRCCLYSKGGLPYFVYLADSLENNKFYLYYYQLRTVNINSDNENIFLTYQGTNYGWKRKDVTAYVLADDTGRNVSEIFSFGKYLFILNKTDENNKVNMYYDDTTSFNFTTTKKTTFSYTDGDNYSLDEMIPFTYDNKLAFIDGGGIYVSNISLFSSIPSTLNFYLLRPFTRMRATTTGNNTTNDKYFPTGSGFYLVNKQFGKIMNNKLYFGGGPDVYNNNFNYIGIYDIENDTVKLPIILDNISREWYVANVITNTVKNSYYVLDRDSKVYETYLEYEVILNLEAEKTIHCDNVLSIEGNVTKVNNTTYITNTSGIVKILTDGPVRVE